MIEVACVERWQKPDDFHRSPDPWSQEELSDTVDAVLEIETWPSKFCFFIDGLDEYAGTANEQYTMGCQLNRLAECSAVKICVSSRPWNPFRSLYDGRADHKLVLQDHNMADLDAYISSKLEADPRFQELAAYDDGATALAVEIR